MKLVFFSLACVLWLAGCSGGQKDLRLRPDAAVEKAFRLSLAYLAFLEEEPEELEADGDNAVMHKLMRAQADRLLDKKQRMLKHRAAAVFASAGITPVSGSHRPLPADYETILIEELARATEAELRIRIEERYPLRPVDEVIAELSRVRPCRWEHGADLSNMPDEQEAILSESSWRCYLLTEILEGMLNGMEDDPECEYWEQHRNANLVRLRLLGFDLARAQSSRPPSGLCISADLGLGESSNALLVYRFAEAYPQFAGAFAKLSPDDLRAIRGEYRGDPRGFAAFLEWCAADFDKDAGERWLNTNRDEQALVWLYFSHIPAGVFQGAGASVESADPDELERQAAENALDQLWDDMERRIAVPRKY